jgi:hypothetical protein
MHLSKKKPYVFSPSLISAVRCFEDKSADWILPTQVIMRAEIITASADSTHISAPAAMQEVHDNNTVDFQGMTERVAQGTDKAEKDNEGVGMIKEVLIGMFNDIFGAKKPRTA